jgi:hypothetical protein
LASRSAHQLLILHLAAKPGQETLASLDKYRYGAALDAFGSGTPDAAMGLDEVKKLVEWKLYVPHLSHLVDVMPLASARTPWRKISASMAPRLDKRLGSSAVH